MKLLVEMLSYKRPHLSLHEEVFIETYLRSLPGYHEDDFGNGIVQIGSSPIMWSCHVDTVHTKGGFQNVTVHDTGYVTSDSNCLGGDNTVGVFLMHQMINHQIPGLYIFHRGEERGRLGSEWLSVNTPELLRDIDFSIAFDRRGFKSIITHQMFGRTASDQFANQLSGLLGLNHKPDDTGLYTDTASYSDLISECTNVSVGFENEHSAAETVYLPYVSKLLSALLSADFTTLRPHRDPSTLSYLPYDNHYRGQEETCMAEYVYRYPDEVAAFLQSMGITIDDLKDFQG